MPRTVDPAKHHARRMAIIDAALTCFAAEGFDRATTASICRTAGIGSGTFFHYFPTKQSVLLAILDHGTAETADWFAAQRERTDPAAVIADYVLHTADEFSDPRVPGFVKAVGSVLADPDIVSALAHDETVVHDGLLPWVLAAQRTGDIRTDLSADRLCIWIMVVLDGFVDRIAARLPFDAAAERDQLIDTVRRLLAP